MSGHAGHDYVNIILLLYALYILCFLCLKEFANKIIFYFLLVFLQHTLDIPNCLGKSIARLPYFCQNRRIFFMYVYVFQRDEMEYPFISMSGKYFQRYRNEMHGLEHVAIRVLVL